MRKSISRKLNRLAVLLIKSVVLVAVVSGSLWLLLHLNFFYVEHIIVEPSGESDFTYIDREVIKDQLLPYEGRRIFWVSTNEVHNLIVENNPFAKSVYVSKRIPDSLIVRIVEKDPMAVVREGDINLIEQVCAGPLLETDFVINSDGTVIANCSENMKACVRVPLLVVDHLESNTEVLLNSQRWASLFDLVNLLTSLKYDVVGYGHHQIHMVFNQDNCQVAGAVNAFYQVYQLLRFLRVHTSSRLIQ